MRMTQNLIHEQPLPKLFGIFDAIPFSSIEVPRKLKPPRRITTKRQVLYEIIILRIKRLTKVNYYNIGNK